MITLYLKTNCPFAARVIASLNALELEYEEKNVAHPGVLDELVARGGKTQSPYLVDGETELYDSEAIVAYLEKTYGAELPPEEKQKLRVHVADSGSCPSD